MEALVGDIGIVAIAGEALIVALAVVKFWPLLWKPRTTSSEHREHPNPSLPLYLYPTFISFLFSLQKPLSLFPLNADQRHDTISMVVKMMRWRSWLPRLEKVRGKARLEDPNSPGLRSGVRVRRERFRAPD